MVQPKTILVVDDDFQVRKATERLLKSADYKVILAESVQSALAELDKVNGKIDLLLTDFDMGIGGDGIDLIQLVRRKGIDVPAIVSSGADPDDLKKMLKLLPGNNSFLPKTGGSELLPLIQQKLAQSPERS